jgi:hypothetical protein
MRLFSFWNALSCVVQDRPPGANEQGEYRQWRKIKALPLRRTLPLVDTCSHERCCEVVHHLKAPV